MTPATLLLIDDDPAYCLQLQAAGRAHRFDIVFHHNLEDGIETLIASRRIRAVILDGRCLLEPDQKSSARSNFVHHAMRQITDIESEYNRVIPVCVNTEQPDEFAEDLEGIVQVYQKLVQHEVMFNWLQGTIAKVPDSLVLKRYDDIFEKTDNRFTDEEEGLLIDVLQSAGTSDPIAIITSLAMLRRLLETLVDIACKEKLKKQPNSFAAGPGSRTKRILDAMNQQQVLPPELIDSAGVLYKTCSKYGNHIDSVLKKQAGFKPDKYTLQRLVFAYLELTDYLLEQPR